NVAIDPVHNQAYVSIGMTGNQAAIQPLDLALGFGTAAEASIALGTPVQIGDFATSEAIAVDAQRSLVLSANEENNYQLFSPATGIVYNNQISDPVGGEFDASAMDCSTGIAMATSEFSYPPQLFLIDLTQATFNNTLKTWSVPSNA